jgi:hypothetical protein
MPMGTMAPATDDANCSASGRSLRSTPIPLLLAGSAIGSARRRARWSWVESSTPVSCATCSTNSASVRHWPRPAGGRSRHSRFRRLRLGAHHLACQGFDPNSVSLLGEVIPAHDPCQQAHEPMGARTRRTDGSRPGVSVSAASSRRAAALGWRRVHRRPAQMPSTILLCARCVSSARSPTARSAPHLEVAAVRRLPGAAP